MISLSLSLSLSLSYCVSIFLFFISFPLPFFAWNVRADWNLIGSLLFAISKEGQQKMDDVPRNSRSSRAHDVIVGFLGAIFIARTVFCLSVCWRYIVSNVIKNARDNLKMDTKLKRHFCEIQHRREWFLTFQSCIWNQFVLPAVSRAVYQGSISWIKIISLSR